MARANSCLAKYASSVTVEPLSYKEPSQRTVWGLFVPNSTNYIWCDWEKKREEETHALQLGIQCQHVKQSSRDIVGHVSAILDKIGMQCNILQIQHGLVMYHAELTSEDHLEIAFMNRFSDENIPAALTKNDGPFSDFSATSPNIICISRERKSNHHNSMQAVH